MPAREPRCQVDRYREATVAQNRAILAAEAKGRPRMLTYTDKIGKTHRRPERSLSPVSINKTITRLGRLLEVVVQRELIGRDAAKVGGKRRRLKTSRPGACLARPRRADRGAAGRGWQDRRGVEARPAREQ